MANKTHIIVFPLAAQGHMNPMVQFAKRLASEGHKVTLLIQTPFQETIQLQPCYSSINIETISNTFPENEKPEIDQGGFLGLLDALEYNLPRVITKMQQQQHQESNNQPKVLVYGAAMTWALGIAQGLGLRGAPFFTQACTAMGIYYHFGLGNFKIPVPEESKVISNLPGIPPLEIKDLPSFISDPDSQPALLSLTINQFSNLETADWVFFNTFDKLEQEVVSWMQKHWRVKTIGPTIPSMYLDKRLENDTDYGINLIKPSAEACLKWLDEREEASVIYVSFGSVANLSEEKIQELTWGLKDSNRYFLWVVREAERSKLPSNFMSETSGKGLVVSWCRQLEVLSHQSVGCFMTHCGWNSTLEALSLGVPMVAMPQWIDQTTNAKCIADVWKVGVRVQANGSGSITREEIKNSINKVMEGERSAEIRRNALRWKELAKEAVDEGGSSDKNINDFLSEISRG